MPKLSTVVGPMGQEPLHLRIDLTANRATPALAGIVAGLLAQAGAHVTVGDERIAPILRVKDLTGLHVHFDRLTWARDEEANRWGK